MLKARQYLDNWSQHAIAMNLFSYEFTLGRTDDQPAYFYQVEFGAVTDVKVD